MNPAFSTSETTSSHERQPTDPRCASSALRTAPASRRERGRSAPARASERGRRVVSVAALAAFVMLFAALNVFGVLYPWMVEGGWVRVANCLQLAYGVVLLTADAAILVARRSRLE